MQEAPVTGSNAKHPFIAAQNMVLGIGLPQNPNEPLKRDLVPSALPASGIPEQIRAELLHGLELLQQVSEGEAALQRLVGGADTERALSAQAAAAFPSLNRCFGQSASPV